MISPAQLEAYDRLGYVYLRNALLPGLLEDARELIEPWVDFQIEEWRQQGRIDRSYREFDFWHRLLEAWRAAGKPMFRRRPNRFLINRQLYDFLHSPVLLDIAERVLGTAELSVHGIFNARPQLPDAPWTETPFHQDSQYWSLNYGGEEPDRERRTHVLTIWIPLQPTDDKTGGLQILSRQDTGDILFAAHDYDFSTTGYLGLSPADIARYPKICEPMQQGDVLLFNQRTPHGAAPNVADRIRWSVDIRYEATSTATVVGRRFGFVVQSGDTSTVTPYEDWAERTASFR